MARYDKYDPISGGFRAPLAADWLAADLNKAIGVGLDANGGIVKGAGNSGLAGVMVLTKKRFAGDIVDTMTDGEIVEFGGVPGTSYFAAGADGAVTNAAAVAPAVSSNVGHTVEADRLIVRFGKAVA